MKAAVYQGIDLPHSIEAVPDPTPRPQEVVVQVEACGICGSDIAMTRVRQLTGALGAMMDQHYAPGAILGHEISGKVVALGSQVERLRIGDRIAPMFLSGCGTCVGCLSGKPNWCKGVYGMAGGYAQYALANENFCVRLGSDLPPDRGSLIEPLATSLHAVTLTKMVPGTRVLVIGAGPIGLGIVHFARRLGAGTIMVIARSDRRRALALTMGATFFRKLDETSAEETADLLGGPPDIVFEAAGMPDVIDQAIAYVAPAGLVVSAGVMVTPEPIDHAAAMMKEIRLQYVMAYERRDFEITAAHLREPDTPLVQLVTDRVNLDAFPILFDALRAGADHCKVLVDPWH